MGVCKTDLQYPFNCRILMKVKVEHTLAYFSQVALSNIGSQNYLEAIYNGLLRPVTQL